MYNNDRTPVGGLKWTFFTSEANYAVHLGATSTLQGSTFTEDPASLLKVQVDHAHSARRAHDDESLNLTLRRHMKADPRGALTGRTGRMVETAGKLGPNGHE